MRRIVLSGASSVGKSTLLDIIEKSQQLTDYVLIKEVVRSLVSKGVRINKGADHRSQLIILEAHYKNTLSYSHMITDRGAIDAFVYATWDYMNGNYTFNQHKEHETVFKSCLPYHHYFYLPIEFPLTKDGVRDEDERYRQEIDKLFKFIYSKYQISYITLRGTPKERFNTFLNNI